MKNKIVALLTVSFALFFLSFVVQTTKELSNSHNNILKSNNVVDVTDSITTRLLVSKEELAIDDTWSQPDFDDRIWSLIKIPYFQIAKEREFKEGNFAYYRIKIPKESFSSLQHLENESFFALHSVYFKKLDIVINGDFYKTNKPVRSMETRLILPVEDDKDNYIAIKGYINTGDTGIDHRDQIMLGKGAEFNELHRASYKAQTVFQLVFILCKGSILFIFALIYILLKVDRSFEKFFLFGICTVIEELIASDYFYGPLNFNQMVYLYNFVNIGAALSVFLFFEELLNQKFVRWIKRGLAIFLILVSTSLAVDALYWNYLINITNFMKFWNLITVSIMLFYLPKVFKFNKSLFAVLIITIVLYVWGALFTNNIGLNLKAYGNLLLFIMVAYQTFVIFRREQLQLKAQEKQILEQEKDVAIGKTAGLLAHDVRKPLEQMKLVIEKIAEGRVDKEFLEIAKKDIDFSVGNVTQLINDIMNYSKSSDVQLKETSFYRILSHSIKQVMSSHPEMDIELAYDFKSKSKVLADEPRLAGVLVNLISNAVEAIRDIGGKIQGKIKLSTTEIENEFIFKIYNDGPQIPQSIINEIFKPLFTHGKASGTGLGLASVQKAINEHQGSIKVENVNSGVEFTIKLQTSTSSDELDLEKFQKSSKIYSYSNIKPLAEGSSANLRVFILNDDPAAIAHFELMFSETSYKPTISCVKDISSAKELIVKSRFDLYFLSKELGGEDIYKSDLNFLQKEVFLYNKSKLPRIDNSELKMIYESRMRILFVDDTKLFRLAWQMFHGEHNIVCVSSPEEALRLVGETKAKIDVCVLDYHYSNSSMNGEELGKTLLELKNDLKVVISSSVEQTGLQFLNVSKRDYELRKLF